MLTFANPVFLWGLLGLAAPVLIHLIQRDLFRPLRFPSIRFIRRGSLPVERRKRLRDLPLLLLRMLLFAAIVFGLARPEWQPEAGAAADTERGELVLFIDVSASMSGWSGLDEARELALERLAEHAGRPAGLVLSSDRVAARVPLTFDHSEIRRALAAADPEPVAGRHRAGLREAVALFSGPGTGRLAIFSDFQLSDWSPGAIPDLSTAEEIEWIRTGRERSDNVAVLSARTFPLADGRRQVIADVRNFGHDETTREIELIAGGSRLARREISLAPGEQRSETFLVSRDAPARAEVRLDPDAFPADDAYNLWLGEPPPARVILVAPLEEEPLKAREIFFLQRALSARTEAQWTAFAPEIVQPGNLAEAAVENAAAVVLLGAAPYLESGQWRALREFASRGGLLLLTPGNAPGRQFAHLRDHGLATFNVAGTVETNRGRQLPFTIDWVNPESGLAAIFRDEAARSLYGVNLYRYLRLENRDDQASVLLRSDSGDPIFFEKPIGRGHLLVSAFAFDPEWTDFPITSAFLPAIRELAGGHFEADRGILQIEAGTPIESLREQIGALRENELAGIDTRSPGIYLAGETPVVVNVPRSESTPATVATLDLSGAAGAAAAGGGRAAEAAGDQPGGVPLWPWLALAALLFFLLEMPVAALLRRRTANAAKPESRRVVENATSEPAEAMR